MGFQKLKIDTPHGSYNPPDSTTCTTMRYSGLSFLSGIIFHQGVTVSAFAICFKNIRRLAFSKVIPERFVYWFGHRLKFQCHFPDHCSAPVIPSGHGWYTGFIQYLSQVSITCIRIFFFLILYPLNNRLAIRLAITNTIFNKLEGRVFNGITRCSSFLRG